MVTRPQTRMWVGLAFSESEFQPLGFAAGDTNLYRYVRNDPTNHTDPSGLEDPSSKPKDQPQLPALPKPVKHGTPIPERKAEAYRVYVAIIGITTENTRIIKNDDGTYTCLEYVLKGGRLEKKITLPYGNEAEADKAMDEIMGRFGFKHDKDTKPGPEAGKEKVAAYGVVTKNQNPDGGPDQVTYLHFAISKDGGYFTSKLGTGPTVEIDSFTVLENPKSDATGLWGYGIVRRWYEKPIPKREETEKK